MKLRFNYPPGLSDRTQGYIETGPAWYRQRQSEHPDCAYLTIQGGMNHYRNMRTVHLTIEDIKELRKELKQLQKTLEAEAVTIENLGPILSSETYPSATVATTKMDYRVIR